MVSMVVTDTAVPAEIANRNNIAGNRKSGPKSALLYFIEISLKLVQTFKEEQHFALIDLEIVV